MEERVPLSAKSTKRTKAKACQSYKAFAAHFERQFGSAEEQVLPAFEAVFCS